MLTRHTWADFVTDLQRRGRSLDALEDLQGLPAREDLEERLKDAFDLELLEEAATRVSS